ncbi:MAG TPA: zinc ribbon domain-containing protein [Chloroflexota bacterium]|nr:zinc ribbon domain-containing protein [Chloroflexota bacterium]
MPLYEYRCAECDARFEKLTSFQQADTGVRCPECGGIHPRRLISVFASFAPAGDGSAAPASGGCGCGGSCSCRGH